jgi:hypothetical protein
MGGAECSERHVTCVRRRSRVRSVCKAASKELDGANAWPPRECLGCLFVAGDQDFAVKVLSEERADLFNFLPCACLS